MFERNNMYKNKIIVIIIIIVVIGISIFIINYIGESNSKYCNDPIYNELAPLFKKKCICEGKIYGKERKYNPVDIPLPQPDYCEGKIIKKYYLFYSPLKKDPSNLVPVHNIIDGINICTKSNNYFINNYYNNSLYLYCYDRNSSQNSKCAETYRQECLSNLIHSIPIYYNYSE